MHYIQPDLASYERKDTSQFGEDGVIETVARCLKIDQGTFFEFGIAPPNPPREGHDLEGCFVGLRNRGWGGVFLDGNEHPRTLGVRREFITALNINQLYVKHAVARDLDFMSIDVDGQEFWIWMALQYRPKVVVIEFNGGLGPDVSKTIQFDINHRWDGTFYHGASLRALDKLSKAKDYTLVWSNGVNAVFVRDDQIANKGDFVYETLYRAYPLHAPDHLNRPWVEI